MGKVEKEKVNLDPIVETSLKGKKDKMYNAVVFIRDTYVLPFKVGSGFGCIYCERTFGIMDQLQQHNKESHANPDEVTVRRILAKLRPNQIVKVNVADLRCRLCEDEIKDFEHLKSHLFTKHDRELEADDEFVVPFRIANGVFECALCGVKHQDYKAVSRHMNEHNGNHVCEQCGIGFITAARLKAHSFSHSSHSFPCDLCEKAFKSRGAMSQHKKHVHQRKSNRRCPHCPETFHDYYHRQKHIISVHKLKVKQHKCQYCTAVFIVQSLLLKHVKRTHTKEQRRECSECGKAYFYASTLKEHMLSKHGDEAGVSFRCSLCPKSYSAKRTLSGHLRKAHPEFKLSCEHCEKVFVIKDSLENHIKEKHMGNST